ncbi:MAG: hypothetical protein EPN24_07465 [Candidatus Methanoperedens sp.]|nr:MAG: hypothetical protein EPN24_07465 [Candidatus Methanoperedens sp.]
MDEFLVKLQKLKSGIFSRMKLLFLLDVVAIFSIFYSLFIVVNLEYFLNKTTFYIPFQVNFIPPVLALLLGAGIAFLLHRKDSKINLYLLIEKKYSDLKEKLRTAYDNRDESNIILDALKMEVSGLLDKVSSAHILTTGKLLSKLVITVIFLAGTVTIAQNPGTYAIPVETIEDIGNTITGNVEKGGNETMDVAGRPENFDKAGEDGGGNIKGKPTIATIAGKNIDLAIFPGYESGYELKEASQTQNQFIKSAAFPVDILGSNVSDGGYSILMKKTETEKQLINKYAVERSTI